MWHHSIYGPSFGGDIRTASDANNNIYSYSYLGHTYEIPPGQTRNVLVGSKKSNYQRLRCSRSFDNSYFDVISL